MTDLRDAALRALASLKGYRRELGCQQPCDAERALETALEQPEQEVKGCDHCNHPLYAAIKCRVCGRVTEQEQEQEPVAWGVDWSRNGDQSCCTIIKQHADGVQEVVAVEYSPPRREWRGLTDEQLLYVYNELPNWGMDMDSLSPKLKQFARAVEAALKEKNHD